MSKLWFPVILLLTFWGMILRAQQLPPFNRPIQNNILNARGVKNHLSSLPLAYPVVSQQKIAKPYQESPQETAIAQAQNNGFYLIQQITQTLSNGALSNNSAHVLIYDLEGNPIEEYSEIWRGDQPEISYKSNKFYDASGNLVQTISQERTGTADQPVLVNRSRNHYEYDPVGRRINAEFDYWSNGAWHESSRMTTIFDDYGQLTEEVRSSYMPNGNGWEFRFRTVNMYDTQGNCIETRRERWSKKDSLWNVYWRGKFTYDEADRMIHDTYESSNGYDTLVFEQQSFYTYDAADNRVAKLTQKPLASAGQELTWENENRTFTSFDTHGNKISETEEKWQNGAWSKIRFEKSAFDVFNKHIDYLSENWVDGRLLNYYKFTNKYDSRHNLIEKLAEEWHTVFQSKFTKDEYKFDEHDNLIEFVSSSLVNDAWTILSKRIYKYTDLLSHPDANPRYTGHQADYLIVHTSAFNEPLDSFIQWRKGQGLTVYNFDIERILDAYGYWPQKEKALREFVTYARTYWPKPAPRFLLLVGDQESVPSYQVEFQYSGKDSVAVDEWFAINGFQEEEKPSLAIGRFPVKNAEELQHIIHKTKVLEETPAEADWTDRFVFLNDVDVATVVQDGYEVMSDNFIESTLPEDYRTIRLDIRETSPNYATKQQFIDALNQGAISVIYNGRGDAFALSSTDFFTVDDVDSLAANDKPSFLTALGVDLVSTSSNDNTLASKLLTFPHGGAAAILTSSGNNSADQNFIESLYLLLFLYPDLTIGEAVLQTKEFILPQGASPDHAIRRYTLLGDPCLNIPFSKISSIEFTEPLKSAEHQADYLVIYAKQFEHSLDSFVNWRENQGYNMKRVDVRKIFSEFHASSTQSEAVRDFISYSHNNWKKPGPTHVLLVGDLADIPSYRVKSTSVGDPDYISIDEWFAVSTFDGDSKPDLAIGRFPVKDNDELNRIISKTMYFEDSLGFYDWPNAFLMVNDAHTNSNNPELFEKLADDFIATTLPSQFNFTRIDIRQTAENYGSRQDLFAALNEGALFFNYFGHGSPSFWSRSRFFTVNDIARIAKTTYPFIHTSIGCSQVFPESDERSLVAELLIYPNAGAVAVLASSGVNIVEQTFIQEFYKLIFSSPTLTIGEAMLNTKSLLIDDESPLSDIVRRYTLLGDPALRMPLQGVTAINNQKAERTPGAISLSQNYPNPFNGTTVIRYDLPQPAHVVLKMYDLLGREVANLVDGNQPAGTHSINFSPHNLASGVFMYRLEIEGFVATRKLLLLK